MFMWLSSFKTKRLFSINAENLWIATFFFGFIWIKFSLINRFQRKHDLWNFPGSAANGPLVILEQHEKSSTYTVSENLFQLILFQLILHMITQMNFYGKMKPSFDVVQCNKCSLHKNITLGKFPPPTFRVVFPSPHHQPFYHWNLTNQFKCLPTALLAFFRAQPSPQLCLLHLYMKQQRVIYAFINFQHSDSNWNIFWIPSFIHIADKSHIQNEIPSKVYLRLPQLRRVLNINPFPSFNLLRRSQEQHQMKVEPDSFFFSLFFFLLVLLILKFTSKIIKPFIKINLGFSDHKKVFFNSQFSLIAAIDYLNSKILQSFPLCINIFFLQHPPCQNQGVLMPGDVDINSKVKHTRSFSLALAWKCYHFNFWNNIQVELRMKFVVTCVDIKLNNQADNVKNPYENVVINTQGLMFCLEMIITHISYGHHFMTLEQDLSMRTNQ
ncbi:hypothetical protein VP01_4393g1 [Puccinia sorghi]|uniref:Uncharacterized protein n=1 Tax=Puccinia sorghi TaxID=27349 RepID=A0A0L6UPP2_9BASI|nr:hypothetical protein VP01_4393g1 [Puccinia sorghi]